SQQVFEPIQAESLSFIRPLATTGEIAIGSDTIAGLDQGVLLGVLAGAFLAAFLFREFRVVTFSEPGAPSILRYTIGAALMGFGGILAVGCTIGAGFTGGSVLALSSIIALAAMMTSAAIADRVVDGGRAGAGSSKEVPSPAEEAGPPQPAILTERLSSSRTTGLCDRYSSTTSQIGGPSVPLFTEAQPAT